MRKGDTELEASGDIEFVEKKAKEFTRILDHDENVGQGPIGGTRPPSSVPHVVMKRPGGAPMPKTGPDKLVVLRDEGYFAEPKQSTDLVAEFRQRIWGVYKAKQISSLLITNAPKLGLRRVPLGHNRFGYAFP